MRRSMIVPLAALALALASPAAADPVVMPPGKAVLAVTGIEIQLPKDTRKGFAWSVSGSWSLIDGGQSFDGRDVIDEKIDGELVAGTWVAAGVFTAGGCDAVVAQTELADPWTAEAKAAGLAWTVRGGSYDLGEPIGRVPTVVMCTKRGDDEQLLLHHYFIAEPTIDRAGALAWQAKSPLVKAIGKAWSSQKSGDVRTRQRPEIRQRGDVAAVRTVTFEKSGLSVELPDDGYVWLSPRADAESGVDWIERMAPAMPSYQLEVILLPDTGSTCADFFEGLMLPKKAGIVPKGLSPGWEAGPALVVDEKLERTACMPIGQALLIVGVFRAPDIGKAADDMTPIVPLLDAIAGAAKKKLTP